MACRLKPKGLVGDDVKFILLISIIAISACVSLPSVEIADNIAQPADSIVSENVSRVSNDNEEFDDICSGMIRQNVTHIMSFDYPVWKTPIKYFIETSNFTGNNYRLNLSLNGFYQSIDYLENISSIRFNPSKKQDAGIIVYVYDSLSQIGLPEAEGLSVVTSFVNYTSHSSGPCTWILTGELYITPSYSCSNYVISLHELSHLLGLGHSKNTNSIMYSYGPACSSKADDSYVQTVKALYP